MSQRPAPTTTGDLARVPVAQLLWHARERRVTGTIAIQAPASAGPLAGESLLAFDGGALAQARLPQTLDPLGFVLRELGAITTEQLDESLLRLAARQGLQGEILVAMGACDGAAVASGLREQVRRKAWRLFALAEGAFQYHAGVDLLAGFGGAREPQDVRPLLWPGVRAHPGHRAVDAVLARLAGQPVRLAAAADVLAGYGFDGDERGALVWLRDGATVDELAGGGVCALPTARALVFFLLLTGGAAVATGPRRAASGVRPMQRPAAASSPGTPAVSIPSPVPSARMSSPGLPAVRTTGTPAATRPSAPPAPRPSMAPPAAPRAEAEARLAAMQNQTWFQMLGVARTATVNEVCAAYARHAGRWQAVSAGGDGPTRAACEDVLGLLGEAQATLTDDGRRREYVAAVEAGQGTPDARRRQAAAARAEADTQLAELCVRRREWPEAERLSRSVLEVAPDSLRAIMALATALLEQRPRGPYQEVELWLARAHDVSRDHDQAHALLGTIHMRKNDHRRALEHYLRALRANPRNLDAARALKLAGVRVRTAAGGDEGAPTPDALLARLMVRR